MSYFHFNKIPQADKDFIVGHLYIFYNDIIKIGLEPQKQSSISESNFALFDWTTNFTAMSIAVFVNPASNDNL